MTLSERFGNHLRANIVGYVALFVALSGTALALPGTEGVKSNDLARGAVKGKAIRAGAVKNSKLADGAVNSPKIADAGIGATDLADAAVLGPKLGNDAVTRPKIAAAAINGGKIADGAIDSAKVDNGSLLEDDFAAGQLSDGFVLVGNSGQFTFQRPGRVFVTATFLASCPVTNCLENYSLTIDGNPVTGSDLTINSRNGQPREQITLIGLSERLTTAPHTVALDAPGGANEVNIRLGGILLQ